MSGSRWQPLPTKKPQAGYSHAPAGMSCRARNSTAVLAPGCGAELAGAELASKRSKRATLGRHSWLMREAWA